MSLLSRCAPVAAGWMALCAAVAAQDNPPVNLPETNAAPETAAQAALADWPVTSAPARYRFGTPHDHPADRAIVKFFFPDPRWLSEPVAFYTDTGMRVGAQLVWSYPNGPSYYVFDSSSGAKQYRAFLGAGNWPPLPLKDLGSGVWVEERKGDGTIVNTLPEMLAAWNKSTEVLGRAQVDGIFQGTSLFGPKQPLLVHFTGYFDAPAAEHLNLAAVSTDASFVLVDGKKVVEWPGHHGWGYDRHMGPPQGGVDVAAGRHVLDYYGAYTALSDDPFMASLAVSGGPFAQLTMLQPETGFFRPVARCGDAIYELHGGMGPAAPRGVPQIAMKWRNEQQVITTSEESDLVMIAYRFQIATLTRYSIAWTFDDGSTATGDGVRHLYLRPGVYPVKLAFKDGGAEVASITQMVDVQLNWSVPWEHTDINDDLRTEILSRDLSKLTGPELSCCFAIFRFFEEEDTLVKLLPLLTAKMADVPETDVAELAKPTAFLLHEDPADAELELPFLRALVARGAAVQHPPPALAAALAGYRLRLAQMTLRVTENRDEVAALMKAIDPAALDGDGRRGMKILQADLALASGDIDGARKQYDALATEPTGPDSRSLVRRTARIEQARAQIGNKDYVAAEDLLNELAWQNPGEKIAPDWAMVRLRLYQEQGPQMAAYLYAKRLLPVVTDAGRSDLLFRLTDLAYAQKDNALAAKTLSELLQKHAYSEEAALAKQKWPGKP